MVEVGNVVFKAKLNADELKASIRQLEQNAKSLNFTINPHVNHKPLVELNKHLDLKLRHYKEVQAYFKSNPLTVHSNKEGMPSVSGGGSSSPQKAPSEIVNPTKTTANEAVKITGLLESSNIILGDVSKSLQKIGSNTSGGTFKTLSTGILLGVGKGVVEQVSPIAEKSLSPLIGSFDLFLETAITGFAKATGDTAKTIGHFIGDNRDQLITIGEAIIPMEELQPLLEASKQGLAKKVASVSFGLADVLDTFGGIEIPAYAQPQIEQGLQKIVDEFISTLSRPVAKLHSVLGEDVIIEQARLTKLQVDKEITRKQEGREAFPVELAETAKSRSGAETKALGLRKELLEHDQKINKILVETAANEAVNIDTVLGLISESGDDSRFKKLKQVALRNAKSKEGYSPENLEEDIETSVSSFQSKMSDYIKKAYKDADKALKEASPQHRKVKEKIRTGKSTAVEKREGAKLEVDVSKSRQKRDYFEDVEKILQDVDAYLIDFAAVMESEIEALILTIKKTGTTIKNQKIIKEAAKGESESLAPLLQSKLLEIEKEKIVGEQINKDYSTESITASGERTKTNKEFNDAIRKHQENLKQLRKEEKEIKQKIKDSIAKEAKAEAKIAKASKERASSKEKITKVPTDAVKSEKKRIQESTDRESKLSRALSSQFISKDIKAGREQDVFSQKVNLQKDINYRANQGFERLAEDFREKAKKIFDLDIDRLQMPEIISSEYLPQDAGASYTARTNQIQVPLETQARGFKNELTQEDIRLIVHELMHAIDLDFGSPTGMARQKKGISKSDIRQKGLEYAKQNIPQTVADFLPRYQDMGMTKDLELELVAESVARTMASELKDKPSNLGILGATTEISKNSGGDLFKNLEIDPKQILKVGDSVKGTPLAESGGDLIEQYTQLDKLLKAIPNLNKEYAEVLQSATISGNYEELENFLVSQVLPLRKQKTLIENSIKQLMEKSGSGLEIPLPELENPKEPVMVELGDSKQVEQISKQIPKDMKEVRLNFIRSLEQTSKSVNLIKKAGTEQQTDEAITAASRIRESLKAAYNELNAILETSNTDIIDAYNSSFVRISENAKDEARKIRQSLLDEDIAVDFHSLGGTLNGLVGNITVWQNSIDRKVKNINKKTKEAAASSSPQQSLDPTQIKEASKAIDKFTESIEEGIQDVISRIDEDDGTMYALPDMAALTEGLGKGLERFIELSINSYINSLSDATVNTKLGSAGEGQTPTRKRELLKLLVKQKVLLKKVIDEYSKEELKALEEIVGSGGAKSMQAGRRKSATASAGIDNIIKRQAKESEKALNENFEEALKGFNAISKNFFGEAINESDLDFKEAIDESLAQLKTSMVELGDVSSQMEEIINAQINTLSLAEIDPAMKKAENKIAMLNRYVQKEQEIRTKLEKATGENETKKYQRWLDLILKKKKEIANEISVVSRLGMTQGLQDFKKLEAQIEAGVRKLGQKYRAKKPLIEERGIVKSKLSQSVDSGDKNLQAIYKNQLKTLDAQLKTYDKIQQEVDELIGKQQQLEAGRRTAIENPKAVFNVGENGGLDEAPSNEVLEWYEDYRDATDRASSASGAFAGRITGVVSSLVGLKIFDSLRVLFMDFSDAAVETAAELEEIKFIYEGIFGVSASDEIDRISQSAIKASVDIGLARKAYIDLAASLAGTEIADSSFDITANFQEKFQRAGLSRDYQQRAFLAVTQIATKGGTVKSEELVGQLSEAMPGAIGDAARAMNMEVSELLANMQNQKILANELLTKMSAMYGSQMQTDTRTYRQLQTDLSSNFIILQEKLGEFGVAVEKTFLKVAIPVVSFFANELEQVGLVLASVITAIGTVSFAKFLSSLGIFSGTTASLKQQALPALTAIKQAISNLSTISLGFLGTGIKQITANLVLMAAQSAIVGVGIYGIVSLTTELLGRNTQLKESTKEIAYWYEQITKATKDINEPKILPEATGTTSRFLDKIAATLYSFPRLFGASKEAMEDFIAKSNIQTFGKLEKQDLANALEDQVQELDKVLGTMDKAFDVSALSGFSQEYTNLNKEITATAQKIEGLRMAAMNPERAEEATNQIKELTEENKNRAKELEALLAKFLPGGIKSASHLIEKIGETRKLIGDNPNIDPAILNYLDQIEDAATKAANNIDTAMKSAANSTLSVQREMQKIAADFEESQQKIQTTSSYAKSKLGEQRLAGGGKLQQQAGLASIDLGVAEAQLESTQQKLNGLQNLLAAVPQSTVEAVNLAVGEFEQMGRSLSELSLADIEEALSTDLAAGTSSEELKQILELLKAIKSEQTNVASSTQQLTDARLQQTDTISGMRTEIAGFARRFEDIQIEIASIQKDKKQQIEDFTREAEDALLSIERQFRNFSEQITEFDKQLSRQIIDLNKELESKTRDLQKLKSSNELRGMLDLGENNLFTEVVNLFEELNANQDELALSEYDIATNRLDTEEQILQISRQIRGFQEQAFDLERQRQQQLIQLARKQEDFVAQQQATWLQITRQIEDMRAEAKSMGFNFDATGNSIESIAQSMADAATKFREFVEQISVASFDVQSAASVKESGSSGNVKGTLGYVGDTGAGPAHLHFEVVMPDGTRINPDTKPEIYKLIQVGDQTLYDISKTEKPSSGQLFGASRDGGRRRHQGRDFNGSNRYGAPIRYLGDDATSIEYGSQTPHLDSGAGHYTDLNLESGMKLRFFHLKKHGDAVISQIEKTASRATEVVRKHGHKQFDEAAQSSLKVAGNFYGRTERLATDAASAYSRMVEAAKKEGVELEITSGFRDIATQERLWNNQVRKKGSESEAAKLSAPPGYSEHHTGYAVDISDKKNPQTRLSTSFENTPAFSWLEKNAGNFGFEMSFPKGNKEGAGYEPWHWRYKGSTQAKEALRLTSPQVSSPESNTNTLGINKNYSKLNELNKDFQSFGNDLTGRVARAAALIISAGEVGSAWLNPSAGDPYSKFGGLGNQMKGPLQIHTAYHSNLDKSGQLNIAKGWLRGDTVDPSGRNKFPASGIGQKVESGEIATGPELLKALQQALPIQTWHGLHKSGGGESRIMESGILDDALSIIKGGGNASVPASSRTSGVLPTISTSKPFTVQRSSVPEMQGLSIPDALSGLSDFTGIDSLNNKLAEIEGTMSRINKLDKESAAEERAKVELEAQNKIAAQLTQHEELRTRISRNIEDLATKEENVLVFSQRQLTVQQEIEKARRDVEQSYVQEIRSMDDRVKEIEKQINSSDELVKKLKEQAAAYKGSAETAAMMANLIDSTVATTNQLKNELNAVNSTAEKFAANMEKAKNEAARMAEFELQEQEVDKQTEAWSNYYDSLSKVSQDQTPAGANLAGQSGGRGLAMRVRRRVQKEFHEISLDVKLGKISAEEGNIRKRLTEIIAENELKIILPIEFAEIEQSSLDKLEEMQASLLEAQGQTAEAQGMRDTLEQTRMRLEYTQQIAELEEKIGMLQGIGGKQDEIARLEGIKKRYEDIYNIQSETYAEQRKREAEQTEKEFKRMELETGIAKEDNPFKVRELEQEQSGMEKSDWLTEQTQELERMAEVLGYSIEQVEAFKVKLGEAAAIRFDELNKSTEIFVDLIKGPGTQFLNDLMDSAENGFKDVGKVFENLAKNIIKRLADIAAEMAIMALIKTVTRGVGGFKHGGTVGISNYNAGGTVDIKNYKTGGAIAYGTMGDAVALGLGMQAAMKKEGDGAIPIVANRYEEVLSRENGDAQLFRKLKNEGEWSSIKKVNGYKYGGSVGSNFAENAPTIMRPANNMFSRNSQQVVNINESTTVVTPDADSFRKSQTQIQIEKERRIRRRFN